MKKYLAAIALTFVVMSSSPAVSGGCDGDHFDKTDAKARTKLQLATVLGSETTCGLQYDQDAIKTFITKQHIDENDATFVSDLSLLSSNAKSEIEEMSKGVLAAHCIQIRRVARHNGFIK
jgi:hypothetical protein